MSPAIWGTEACSAFSKAQSLQYHGPTSKPARACTCLISNIDYTVLSAPR